MEMKRRVHLFGDHAITVTWEVATATAAESPASAPFAHAPLEDGLGL